MVTEIINRGHICHPTELEKKLYLFRTKSIYIDTVFTDKPFESLHLSGRTSRIATEKSNFITFLVCWCVTDRTVCWRNNRFFCTISRFYNWSNNLRYDLSGTMNKNLISDTEIFLRSFVIVMKCRVLNCYPHYIDRFHMGHRSDSTCTTNRMFYINDFGSSVFCREFIGYSIPWMMRSHTENWPQMKIVYFDNKPINIKRANRLFTHFLNQGNDRFNTIFFFKK